MGNAVSVLIVEDSEDDALLLLMSLRRAGFEPIWRRVDTESALSAALDERSWDIVTSDHHMPAFSSTQALALVRARGLDVPFIIVSGSIGEEAAVAAMKAGAQDFIMKGHMARLPVAVERELRDAEERRARREAERQIRKMAYYDQHTSLPNRALFREQLEALLQQHGEHARPLTLLGMKVDNLREINNTLGHQTGERMLVEVARRMALVAGERLLARTNTDAFALALSEDVATALSLARDLQEAVEAPIVIDAMEIDAALSVGIARFPEHGTAGDLLLQRSDVALAQALERSSKVAVYDRDRDPYQPARLSLIADLRRAIEGGQLDVHYQPKVHIASGRLAGVEALVRWEHPKLGWLPPDRFVPLAEQTGLINPLAHFVLSRSMKQWHAWHRAGLDASIAVNLSAKNLQSAELTDQLGGLLSTSGMPADKLVLEVTESAIMSDEPRVEELLVRLDAQGVQIAIDDFGTGYSSFANLRRLPVSEIKIDKSFVMGMLSSEQDCMIVASITELGHNLGLHVVAEGVETGPAWYALQDLGCDLAQGYYLSRPVPADALLDWSRSFAGVDPRGLDNERITR